MQLLAVFQQLKRKHTEACGIGGIVDRGTVTMGSALIV